MLRSSLRFSFHFVVPGTNDPGTGGIKSRRAFGSGSRGSEAGLASLGLPCRRRCALTITAGLAASRWRRTFRNGLGPKASAVRQVFSIPVPGPFSDNTLEGCWLIRPMEKDSNLRQSEPKSDALTKLSYPWCRQQDSNLRPPDPNPALSQTELHPRSQSPKRRRIQGGKATCTGGDKSSNRCARFGFRDRERAYRPCDGLSQAALWRRICGFFRRWYFGNSAQG